MAKKRLFERINTSKMQKNEAFMLPNSHKYLILVRSTGIEDFLKTLNAFIHKACSV
jgi:hypothetical protein